MIKNIVIICIMVLGLVGLYSILAVLFLACVVALMLVVGVRLGAVLWRALT